MTFSNVIDVTHRDTKIKNVKINIKKKQQGISMYYHQSKCFIVDLLLNYFISHREYDQWVNETINLLSIV